jgi:hypothetical protein
MVLIPSSFGTPTLCGFMARVQVKKEQEATDIPRLLYFKNLDVCLMCFQNWYSISGYSFI